MPVVELCRECYEHSSSYKAACDAAIAKCDGVLRIEYAECRSKCRIALDKWSKDCGAADRSRDAKRYIASDALGAMHKNAYKTMLALRDAGYVPENKDTVRAVEFYDCDPVSLQCERDYDAVIKAVDTEYTTALKAVVALFDEATFEAADAGYDAAIKAAEAEYSNMIEAAKAEYSATFKAQNDKYEALYIAEVKCHNEAIVAAHAAHRAEVCKGSSG